MRALAFALRTSLVSSACLALALAPACTTSTGDGDGDGDGDGALVLNEIAAAGDPFDWVELKNTSGSDIPLAGLALAQDDPPTVRVPVGDGLDDTLAAGAYRVVELDEGALFRLGAAETLHLVDGDGTVLDTFTWVAGDSPRGGSFGRIPDGTGDARRLAVPTKGAENDDSPAPVCGDGARTFYEICDDDDFGAHSCESLGFSGGALSCDDDCLGVSTASCTFTRGPVVINEVTSTESDDIELYNTSSTAVEITGFALFDTGYDPIFDDGTSADIERIGTFTLAAGAYLVLSKGDAHEIGLGDVDTLTLMDDDGVVQDRVSWSSGEAAVSYCRIPNGTGNFEPCDARTLGASND